MGSVRTWWARLWGGGTYASLDVAQGELRLRPATARQLNTPPQGQVWRSYYYAGAVRVAVRERDAAGSAVHYLLSDHLGSLSEVVTGASVNASQRYAAWGETRDTLGSPPTRFQFTGQYKAHDS